MLRDLLGQVKNRVAGHDEPPGGRLDVLAEDLRSLERTVSDLRMEVQALRAALGAQETAPAAAAAPKRRGRKAEKAEKAAPVARIEVREEDCIGCGTCVDFAPTVFAIKNNGRAHVISQDGPAEAIEDAIRGCPTSCIVRVT